MKTPRAFRFSGWLLIVALGILVVHGFVLIRSAEHLDQAREFARAGRIPEAAREYQTAIGYAAPFNPYCRAAAEELEILAEECSVSRPILGANLYDRLRRSLRGTRWLLQPEGISSSGSLRSGLSPAESGPP